MFSIQKVAAQEKSSIWQNNVNRFQRYKPTARIWYQKSNSKRYGLFIWFKSHWKCVILYCCKLCSIKGVYSRGLHYSQLSFENRSDNDRYYIVKIKSNLAHWWTECLLIAGMHPKEVESKMEATNTSVKNYELFIIMTIFGKTLR